MALVACTAQHFQQHDVAHQQVLTPEQ